MNRSSLIVALIVPLIATALLTERPSHAQLVSVPIELQAELLSKVASYDRNMAGRAGDRLQVLVLTNGGDTDSVRFGNRMQGALQSIAQIGGLPHDERIAPYTSAADLVSQVRARRIAIIFLGPALVDQVAAIRDALDGVDVLTVASIPEYVAQGVVLGFDVVSGKPKLLVNLARARKQHVELRAEVLKLMKVID
jgi:hypothetical protein